jgi:hypothetical protein
LQAIQRQNGRNVSQNKEKGIGTMKRHSRVLGMIQAFLLQTMEVMYQELLLSSILVQFLCQKLLLLIQVEFALFASPLPLVELDPKKKKDKKQKKSFSLARKLSLRDKGKKKEEKKPDKAQDYLNQLLKESRPFEPQ